MKRPVVALLVGLGLGLLASPSASAADPSGRPVRASHRVVGHLDGADLQAWGVLSQRRPTGDEAVVAYRAFVLAWPDSPLAEAAWDRLVALGAADTEADTATARQTLARVKARWTEHQRALASAQRPGRSQVVLDLDETTGATALLQGD